MSAEIVRLHPELSNELRVEPDKILADANDRLATVVVLGLDRDGALYLAASDGAERAYFLMERAKLWLLDDQTARS